MIENNVRLRKEYKLKTTQSNFKIIFGTTNRINPSVIYIKLNTWVKYVGIIKDYNDNINYLNTSTKLAIKKQLKHLCTKIIIRRLFLLSMKMKNSK